MAEYTNSMYQGGVSTFDSNYGSKEFFTGYRATGGSLGMTTDPRTANIIKDASAKLSSSAKHMELALVSQELFDSVPKQQLKEVKQLSKLTGSTVSVHGPVIDTSGINRDGFSELNRQSSERKVIEAIKRSHEVDPEGNTIVVFHSSEGIPGSDWKKIGDQKNREASRIIAVNRETGRMVPVEEDKKYVKKYLPLEGEKTYSAEKNLDMHNKTEWDNSMDQVIFNKERADEILKKNEIQIRHLLTLAGPDGRLDTSKLSPIQKEAYNNYNIARTYIDDVDTHVKSFFHRAYKYGNESQRNRLKGISKEYAGKLNTEMKEGSQNPIKQSEAMNYLLAELKERKLAPDINVPVEDFAVEQSSKTFGNAAFEGYKKFGNKAPIVSIENPPAGFALSTGEGLRALVKASRDKFVEKAIKEKEISKSEAKQLAEKFIGATWDVGHINMIRGRGHGEKEIIKETEKIAPYVKHVHFSDNFGLEHTELPMGMGNVPLKKIMEKLGEKGFKAKKIIEAAQWWQHFQTAPLKETMQGVGSNIYSDGVGPYWNQALGFEQGYMTGLEGPWLPNNNYETFGTGFSRLPQDLGGNLQQGTGGRMGGGRD